MKWNRVTSGRPQCIEIVCVPRGRRKTLYLEKCGKKAAWRPRGRAFFKMGLCDPHKKSFDQRVAAAREAIMKTFPGVSGKVQQVQAAQGGKS